MKSKHLISRMNSLNHVVIILISFSLLVIQLLIILIVLLSDFDGLERDRKSSVTRDMVAAAMAINNAAANNNGSSSPLGSGSAATSSSGSSSDGSPVQSAIEETKAPLARAITPPVSTFVTPSSSHVAIATPSRESISREAKAEAPLVSASSEVTEVSIPAFQVLKRNHVVCHTRSPHWQPNNIVLI
jgi:activator of HSP90 ATPase